MNCQFCNEPCNQKFKYRPKSKYWRWECILCQVQFACSPTFDNIEVIKFETKIKDDRLYEIDLQMKKNRTDINLLTKVINTEDQYMSQLVISFDQILDITPNNFQDKLKTYLLFL